MSDRRDPRSLIHTRANTTGLGDLGDAAAARGFARQSATAPRSPSRAFSGITLTETPDLSVFDTSRRT